MSVARLELRPAQAKVLADVSAAWRAGHKRVMVSAACGFGKSEVAAAILQATHDNGKRGAFIADRRALVEQIVERFDKYDLPCGVLMADHERFAPSRLIQACSAQTLARRRWPDANLIVVDEAHILSETVKKKLQQKDCYAIGLSATAITKGLGKYFDTVVNAPTTNSLIEQGLLVPLRLFSCTEPNMKDVKVNSLGEWDEKETEKRALEVVGDVVHEYMRNGEGKQFIGFAASIAHAEELRRQFLAAGINVATYTANDQPEDRSEIVQEFKKPNSAVRGILSVEALTRGFDCPHVEVLIDARPLRKAVHVFVQMLGRVMRTAPGKTHATVLSHSGNISRFWHEWNSLFEHGVTELDDGKPKKKAAAKKTEAEPVKCPQCRSLHRPMPHCPVCGLEYERKQSIQHVPGSLRELIAGGYHRELTHDLWPQVARYCLDRRNGDNDAARRMALAVYRDMVGDWPRARWENTKPSEIVSQEVRNRILSTQIKFAKRRERERVSA
jgi:superfamily II DNA or RNA helicase